MLAREPLNACIPHFVNASYVLHWIPIGLRQFPVVTMLYETSLPEEVLDWECVIEHLIFPAPFVENN